MTTDAIRAAMDADPTAATFLDRQQAEVVADDRAEPPAWAITRTGAAVLARFKAARQRLALEDVRESA